MIRTAGISAALHGVMEDNGRKAVGDRIDVARSTKTIDKRKPCVWQENEDGVWNTNCDNAHEFIAGSPNDNNYRYCPYCGRYLKSLNYSNGSLSCLPNAKADLPGGKDAE